MFLKAGALSLALLLASRILGLARESAQAAAFGTTGLADIVVLMLTLPDWITGLLASGALAYVLLPAWAAQSPGRIASSQRRTAWVLAGSGGVIGLALALGQDLVMGWFAPGLSVPLRGLAGHALMWSAAAVPAALLAALWTTRLQHGQDFIGMYGANLAVNLALIAAIAVAGSGAAAGLQPVRWLGVGLLGAMGLRLAWLAWRLRGLGGEGDAPHSTEATQAALPGPQARLWLWAVLVAGLPLALPFVARSIASQGGEGSLATFNYAWKLVELPLVLAIQLVASLAFPAIARAVAAGGGGAAATAAVRAAFALAWCLACAAAAGMLVGAPALAQLLFGWGRMEPQALVRVAQWGTTAAWGLLPQALAAVAMTVLASQRRLAIPAAIYGAALAAVLAAGASGVSDGGALMLVLNGVLAAVALALVTAMGWRAGWLPWRSMALSLATLLALAAAQAAAHAAGVRAEGLSAGAALAVVFAAAVVVVTALGATELRQALRR